MNSETQLFLFHSSYLREENMQWLIDDINNLLKQLSSKPRKITFEDLERVYEDDFKICLALERLENPTPQRPFNAVGMGGIFFKETLLRKKAFIEDVVVDKNHRRRHLAEKIVSKLIGVARNWEADRIILTSEPKRIAANALYQKLGFKKKDTNFYKKKL